MPSEFLQIPQGRLEIAWFGAGPRRIVLLHEGLGCVALWRDFPEKLARATNSRVFAWSRLGYGQSDPITLPRPLDYMEREAALLPTVLAAAGIDRPILLGHSDGASIAALAARQVSPAALILMAPHFFVEDMCTAAIAEARAAYPDKLRHRLARYHADVDGAFLGWNGAWLDPGFRDWRISHCLPAITAPMLLLQGSADEYGTLAQLREAEALSGGPTEMLCLDGARHAPHLDAPEATLEAIAGFLEKYC